MTGPQPSSSPMEIEVIVCSHFQIQTQWYEYIHMGEYDILSEGMKIHDMPSWYFLDTEYDMPVDSSWKYYKYIF
jgi:hypothetical protein